MHGMIATITFLLKLTTIAYAPGSEFSGPWLTDDGEAAIEFRTCGEGLCGVIVWLKSPLDDGEPARDDHNPDPRLRDRPLCGLAVIGSLHRNGDQMDGGWIYDPEGGTRYQVAIRQRQRDTLDVTGFVGIETFGRRVKWRRAPVDLPRCAPGAGSTGL
ncbi:hypothetical protein GCM10007301_07460 [Azorhizobium oxalatiphilum]|uniref:DUF2147 domain-containing protein n=1 Tax=Azorhizobium oxalatiphilum TaxID=980631 RepID=A0A917BNB9_9HYPH|nr:DUF2147 domain-containing protein [Azorhizobium oxalatiphilum]GGF50582.1 hypothetical protein GCM10007301_07460 [Azorhizobium oxalatiphilum]